MILTLSSRVIGSGSVMATTWKQSTTQRSESCTSSASTRLRRRSRRSRRASSVNKESSGNGRWCVFSNLHNTLLAAVFTALKTHVIVVIRGNEKRLNHSCVADVRNQNATGRTEVLKSRPMGGWRRCRGKLNW